MRVLSGPGRRAVLAGATAVVLSLTTAPAAQATHHEPETRRGSLVLVGGGLKDDNAQVYGEIIRRAGGAKARIGVITAASVPESQDPDAGDPDKCSNSACNGAYYASLFKRYGAADAQWIPVDLDHITNADSDAVAAQVDSMTGFFFGGGDQARYLTTLLHADAHTDSKVLAAIRRKLTRGAVVSGSSAGAQIASGPDMVSGGDSYQSLRDGSAPGYFDDPTRLGYFPAGGFGFLRSGLIDTHTGTYGREGRALRLAADTEHNRVYALDENTALIVDSPGTRHEALSVAGPGGISILDLRKARTRTTPAGWSISNARYSYLANGDRYDPRHWLASPGHDKRPLIPDTSSSVPANTDVFCSAANTEGTPYSFRATARALASTRGQHSATATTYETGPRFTVTFTTEPGFSAWTNDATTAQTLIGMQIAVAPQQEAP
ncbi:cyanophycinase [Streptomyces sp. NPDC002580]|uniref:cyanophycinase n=1 Tax=Streptomyces sp. NPDC002580 TaxID=3364653 RepID=UPI0036BD6A43